MNLLKELISLNEALMVNNPMQEIKDVLKGAGFYVEPHSKNHFIVYRDSNSGNEEDWCVEIEFREDNDIVELYTGNPETSRKENRRVFTPHFKSPSAKGVHDIDSIVDEIYSRLKK